MHNIPYCPNSECSTNNSEEESKPEFRKRGFGKNYQSEKIQRYQCKTCWHVFNINTFHIDYYTHKKICYKSLVDSLVSSSGIRDMARQFKCKPKAIQNRIDRLARKASALTAQIVNSINLNEDLVADGLESFIYSQFFPTNINILIGQRSQFLYFFNAFYFHRKGRMTDWQKERAKEVYRNAQFEEKAPSKAFKQLLDVVADLLDNSTKETLTLDTDENTIYRYQFKKHERMGNVQHRTTNSQKKRNSQNKLFSCNYLDRETRKDMAEHGRETTQFGRNMNNSMNRFSVYTFWHNFKKPYRINKWKNGKEIEYKTHAEAAGISRGLAAEIGNRLFDDSRIHFFTVKHQLNSFQAALWKKELMNPVNPGPV